MNYELDDVDRDLIAKCREAIEYADNGDPAKDVIDDDELIDAVRLLLDIVDAAPIAQPEPALPEQAPEPVGEVTGRDPIYVVWFNGQPPTGTKLYTALPEQAGGALTPDRELLAEFVAAEDERRDIMLRISPVEPGCEREVLLGLNQTRRANALANARRALTTARATPEPIADAQKSVSASTEPGLINLRHSSGASASARATPAADVRDANARRYEWLRDPENTEGPSIVATHSRLDLDEAIDAAIAKETP